RAATGSWQAPSGGRRASRPCRLQPSYLRCRKRHDAFGFTTRWAGNRGQVESATAPLVPKGVTWQTLRELAEFRSTKRCAISLYLDLDPSATPTPAALDTRFNSALSEIERQYVPDEEDGARRRAIRSDLERIRRFWDHELDRAGARGLAIFSAEEDGLF